MEKFNTMYALVVPLDQANIDTDQIIPKQYLKSIERTGFGPNLFDDWRYHDPGEPGMDHSTRRVNEDFVLNHPHYQGGEILLTRENFGCGSSREHAPWALLDHGFRCVIAPSFADIFYNNCFKNGILPVVLTHQQVDELFDAVTAEKGFKLSVSLPEQTVTRDDGIEYAFEVDPNKKHRLLEGLDDIGVTLEKADEIHAYEASRKQITPWLFNS